jgi:hypothetical protein
MATDAYATWRKTELGAHEDIPPVLQWEQDGDLTRAESTATAPGLAYRQPCSG